MRKHIISASIILLSIFAVFNSTAQTVKKTDFSGTWVIDLPKSQFGEVPTYTAAKQLKVSQTSDDIKIELVTISDSGADSTANEILSLKGKALEITGGDHRKRKITAQLAEDGNTITIHILASEPDDPETEQFVSNETWQLCRTDGTLLVKKTVKVAEGSDYATVAVYDKK